MKKSSIVLIIICIVLVSCKPNNAKKEPATPKKLEAIVKEGYELYKPTEDIKTVLMLFGGFPESPADIKREFPILELARANNIAVVLLNFNQKLWLEENEKQQLSKDLQNIVEAHELPTDNIYMGGFSSGGVVSLLISNYIIGMKQFYIDPKGVFIADSPIDLVALYTSSVKNIENNFSEVSVQESTWLLETLANNFGNPNEAIENYEDKSVFTHKTNHTANLNNLKNTKLRFYTEPDTLWWKKNRMAEYEQMNAFYIKELAESLKTKGFENVEYIPTTNKGYRANGDRHPHSWSIVDKNDLINWMLGK